MLIRKATHSDSRRISYLIQKNTEKVRENNYSKDQKKVWKRSNTPREIENILKNRILFCGFIKNKLAGTIGLQKNEIVGLYVSYSMRGLGIGRKLLNHLEDYALNRNMEKLILHSTPSAINFYTLNGYETLSSGTIKISGIEFKETKMEKKLKRPSSAITTR
jgi:GNAT superfamily N-acetyltransferase